MTKKTRTETFDREKQDAEEAAERRRRREATERRARPPSQIPEGEMTIAQAIVHWNRWCEGFVNLPVERMSMQSARVFIQLSMASMESPDKLPDSLEGDLQSFFPLQVMRKRVEYFKLDVSPYIPFLVCTVTGIEKVGEVVMYTHALKWAQVNRFGGAKIDSEKFAKLFPLGYPTPEALHDHWYKQKYKTKGSIGDNFLDMVRPDMMIRVEDIPPEKEEKDGANL